MFNRIYDSQKVYGADAEAYWRNAVQKLFFENENPLEPDILFDEEKMKNEIEEFINGLQNYMVTPGFKAKAVAPAVTDPGPHIQVLIDAICIVMDVPKRIFMGSERGELATREDQKKWDKRVGGRQNRWCTPGVVIPHLSRLILLGVLPTPRPGNRLLTTWPDLSFSTEEEIANILFKRTQALVTFVEGGGGRLFAPKDYLIREMGYTMQEAEEVLEEARSYWQSEGKQMFEQEQTRKMARDATRAEMKSTGER